MKALRFRKPFGMGDRARCRGVAAEEVEWLPGTIVVAVRDPLTQCYSLPLDGELSRD